MRELKRRRGAFRLASGSTPSSNKLPRRISTPPTREPCNTLGNCARYVRHTEALYGSGEGSWVSPRQCEAAR
ncbi:hypothetical protein GY45DRAFT_322404 [Cubamyces sp. BRFM 1775]|nr:hypothetical protein GY45DRAFT_322404 [Cubamyces sp. BRFM 1775]